MERRMRNETVIEIMEADNTVVEMIQCLSCKYPKRSMWYGRLRCMVERRIIKKVADWKPE